jgi:hypothetical protein
MSGMEVLTLLRNALIAKQRVTLSETDDRLVFPSGQSHPCATPTAYVSQGGAGEPYTLGSVWLLCQEHPDSGLGDYRRALRPYADAARKEGRAPSITAIARVDQKDLVAYVSGKTSESTAVKGEAQTIFDAVETGAPSRGEAAHKRARLEAGDGQAVVDGRSGQQQGDAPAAASLAAGGDAAAVLAKGSSRAAAKGADASAGGLAGAGLAAGVPASAQAAVAAAEAAAAGSSSRSTQPADYLPRLATVEDILVREKVLTSRHSILLAPDKKSFKDVEQLFKATLKAAKRKANSHAKTKSNSQVERHMDRIRLSTKGNYYDKRTVHNPTGVMDTKMGSEAADMRINYEGSMKSGLSFGQSSSTSTDGARARGGGGGSTAASSKSAGLVGSGGGAGAGGVPIIIVPSVGSSALTIFNVRDVLEKGAFRSTQEVKAAGGGRREARLQLVRQMPDGSARRYQVVDNARSLSKRDWPCVI